MPVIEIFNKYTEFFHLFALDYEKKTGKKIQTEDINETISSFKPELLNFAVKLGNEKKYKDYLKLKKVSKGTGSKKDKEKNDGFICRYSGGLCFDVWSQDKSM